MKIKVLNLDGRLIGGDENCLLVAEVGTTCLGDYAKALELVEAAFLAGMDAVKFQLIDPEQISDKSVTYSMNVDGVVQQVNMYDMFKRLSFNEEEWAGIARACKQKGMLFFATVDYLEGVDLLEKVGVSAHKIGAWDGTYRPLIEHIGRTKKPMFVDLGPTTKTEVQDMVGWYLNAGGTAVLFMHDFHTQNDVQMNLRTISHLNDCYPWPAGFSSPALDHDLDIAALALGAAYLEKRLILSRSEPAFHAHESCEPTELKAWVERMRHVERALGKPEIIPSDIDLQGKRNYYRSICTLRPIAQGEVFTSENIGGKRPGTGIPTTRLDDFFGHKATSDLPADKLLEEQDSL